MRHVPARDFAPQPVNHTPVVSSGFLRMLAWALPVGALMWVGIIVGLRAVFA